MAKFLHIADLHLGYRQYGMPQREEDVYLALLEVEKLALEQVADVVIAGDLFDTPKPPARAVLELKKFVSHLESNGLRVMAIEGNHDATKDNYWLEVCGIRPLDSEVPAKIGECLVKGINFDSSEKVLAKIDEMVANEEHCDILVMHAGFVEMQGDYASEFSTEELSQKLKLLDCKYVANGHIHMWAQVESNGVTFCQPGSLEIKSINEPHRKQAALVEIAGNNVKVTQLVYPVRKVFVKQIDTEEELQKVLCSLSSYSKHLSVMYINRTLENAVELLTKEFSKYPGAMYRIVPVGEVNDFDRTTAFNNLGDAIEEYFGKDTPEYTLISRCLQTPENAANIARGFIDGQ